MTRHPLYGTWAWESMREGDKLEIKEIKENLQKLYHLKIRLLIISYYGEKWRIIRTETLSNQHGRRCRSVWRRLKGGRSWTVVPTVITWLQLYAASGSARGLRTSLLKYWGWNMINIFVLLRNLKERKRDPFNMMIVKLWMILIDNTKK